ncbi:hypothetical protein [Ferrimonas marina]|uniref:Uncharacterized protein n=1 Tax=Ferrimonas marina TaxID=299255 RepID=A0A1M5P6X7_9GAMM|nr:hypothetical protein [Ferrimonas marina]SHG97581.1 hypothetical protein SAMN02745129_1313 [Ferrimonas marina]
MKYAVLLSALLAASPAMANSLDIGDGQSQFAIYDTDKVTKLYLGGSGSSRVAISQEFADIVDSFNLQERHIEPLLAAVLGGRGWNNIHGLPGVELGFLNPNSFSLKLHTGKGPVDTVVFQGAAVEGIINSVARGNVDIKNNQSQFAEFYSDGSGNIWIGGGRSDAVRNVSEEFAEITGGSKIHCDQRGNREVEGLFAGLVEDSGWNDPHGIENARLAGLTDTSYTIEFGAAGPTTKRITFTGSCATDAIEAVDLGLINNGDKNSRFATFDFDIKAKWTMLGTGRYVTDEFIALAGKNNMDLNGAVALFNALTEHKNGGVEGVELVGITPTSFAIAVHSPNHPMVQTLLIKGAGIEAAIAAKMDSLFGE